MDAARQGLKLPARARGTKAVVKYMSAKSLPLNRHPLRPRQSEWGGPHALLELGEWANSRCDDSPQLRETDRLAAIEQQQPAHVYRETWPLQCDERSLECAEPVPGCHSPTVNVPHGGANALQAYKGRALGPPYLRVASGKKPEVLIRFRADHPTLP